MDPFVVWLSYSAKKVFSNVRHIRRSLNPVWDEKLLFHVHKYEWSFRLVAAHRPSMGLKLSSNKGHFGGAATEITELAENFPQFPEKDPDRLVP